MRKVLACAAICAALMGASSTAFAQNGRSTTNQGSTPNGKPFQQIQSQIDQVNAEIAALNAQVSALNAQVQDIRTQIDTVESNLQSQIDAVYADLSQQIADLSGRVTTVEGAVNTIQDTLVANQSAIGALNAAVSALQSALGTAQSQLAALQTQTADNTSAITSLSASQLAAVSSLQNQINQINNAIASHNTQISNLQSQNNSLNQILANMINATCSVGQAIADIGPMGSITCIKVSAGGQFAIASNLVQMSGSGGNYHVAAVCPGGYTATGGGFDRGSAQEWVSYVSRLDVRDYSHYDYFQDWYYPYDGYWYWQSSYDNNYYPSASYSSFYRDAVSILGSGPTNGGWFARAEFRPTQYWYYPNFLYVTAACMKLS